MKGVIGLVSVEDFYSDKYFTVTDFKGKELLLPRDMFFEISANINFDLKAIYNILISNFQSCMIPGYFVVVDEIRVPCRHFDCEVKKYNREKPDVWAIESKSLHDNNKYLLHFIYPLDEDVPTPKLSVSIFAEYLQTTGRHHHLTMDSNFYSAADFHNIINWGFEATISCKSNSPSWIFEDALMKNLPWGYTRIASNEDCVAVTTRNKGYLNLISNLYTAEDNQDEYVSEDRRTLMNIYDKTKGSADAFGHLYKSYYPNEEFKKYTMTLLVGWLSFAMTNSFILYSLAHDDISHREFVREIAESLLRSK